MAHKELLTAWIKDAYGMETALVPVLENHAKDAKNHPGMRDRIEQHIEETRHHADLLKQVLARYGESPNAVKTAIGGMLGAMQSVSTGPFEDELVKNGLSDYAAENFEIASYNALIVAAQVLGDEESVQIFEQILDDEEDMAEFLEENLPTAVEEMMQKKEMEHANAG